MPIVWRLITHHANSRMALAWMLRAGIIALGWGAIGDLRRYRSPAEISAAVRRLHPGLANVGEAARCLWSFGNEVGIGNLVILAAEGKRQAVVEVVGGYGWAIEPPLAVLGNYQHQIPARLRPDIDPDQLWVRSGAGPVPGDNVRWALIRLAAQRPAAVAG
jgi:hypothetical protein